MKSGLWCSSNRASVLGRNASEAAPAVQMLRPLLTFTMPHTLHHLLSRLQLADILPALTFGLGLVHGSKSHHGMQSTLYTLSWFGLRPGHIPLHRQHPELLCCLRERAASKLCHPPRNGSRCLESDQSGIVTSQRGHHAARSPRRWSYTLGWSGKY